MRRLLSTTLQSCAVDTDAHVTAASEGRRVWLSSGRKHATTSIRLIQVALAAVLGAAALAGSADVRAQSLFTEFQIPTVPGSFPLSVVEGPDGALWFVQRNSNTVGRMTTAGVVTTYPIPTLDSPQSNRIGTRRQFVVHRGRRRFGRRDHRISSAPAWKSSLSYCGRLRRCALVR
jgi:streptogramin lyase